MADRTSAGLFGDIFRALAEHVPPGKSRDELSLRFWGMASDYDFSEYQMDADEALLALGLARRGVDPDWPDEGEVVLYGPIE